jgi:hypothetical protein
MQILWKVRLKVENEIWAMLRKLMLKNQAEEMDCEREIETAINKLWIE